MAVIVIGVTRSSHGSSSDSSSILWIVDHLSHVSASSQVEILGALRGGVEEASLGINHCSPTRRLTAITATRRQHSARPLTISNSAVAQFLAEP